MRSGSISHRAAAFAVVVAFAVGLIGSLALRPPGGARNATADSANAVLRPMNWRVPASFQTTMPGLGDTPLYVARMLRESSNDAVILQLFEPGEIVPAFSITDAVRDGKVEAGYTWLGYDQGKTAAAALLAAITFGIEPD